MSDSDKKRPEKRKNRFVFGEIVHPAKKVKTGAEGGFCRACGARYNIETPLCPLCRAGVEHKHPFNK